MGIPYYELTPDAFPFTIELIDVDNDETLHKVEVTGPGPVRIPGFAPRRVRVRAEFADGNVIEETPDTLGGPS